MAENLSLDEKFISNIFQKYLKIKIILAKVSKKSSGHLREKTVQYGSLIENYQEFIEYQNYLQIVETILALMPRSEYTCLIRDFLTVEPDKFWWKKYYSQNDYQKLRQKSINRFLYLFLI